MINSGILTLGKREIENLLVKCPNTGCGAVRRCHVDEHTRTLCPHAIVSCKYMGIGCAAKLKKKDMAAHEEDIKLHFQMALETTNSLQHTVQSMLEKGKRSEGLTFALTEYQRRKDANESVTSSSFYTSGYHMALRVDANGVGDSVGTHVAVFGSILTGKFDATLRWPFVGKFTFTLLNQLEDRNHYTRDVSITTELNIRAHSTSWGFPAFISNSALAHDSVENTQYLKDDTLYFRLSVEVADHRPWLVCTAN